MGKGRRPAWEAAFFKEAGRSCWRGASGATNAQRGHRHASMQCKCRDHASHAACNTHMRTSISAHQHAHRRGVLPRMLAHTTRLLSHTCTSSSRRKPCSWRGSAASTLPAHVLACMRVQADPGQAADCVPSFPPRPPPPICSCARAPLQLGTHIRGKRKREELAGLMRKMAKK